MVFLQVECQLLVNDQQMTTDGALIGWDRLALFLCTGVTQAPFHAVGHVQDLRHCWYIYESETLIARTRSASVV